MSDILEYFDSIDIDVAKRKYYNVNKVNAVLEDLRGMAESLVEENERLRAEIAELRDRDRLSEETLSGMQAVYRETLEKAHQRADKLVQSAEEYSSRLNQDTAEKADYAARQVEACINAVRVREEQNIEFLNAKLQTFLTDLYSSGAAENTEAGSLEQKKQIDNSTFAEEEYEIKAGKEDEPGSISGIQNRVGQIAEEIRALESEN